MKKLFCVICSKYQRLEKPNTWYLLEKTLVLSINAWKVSKYGVFSGPYITAFGLNTERYGLFLRIQFEYGKIRTRKNPVFGHFSRSVLYIKSCLKKTWNKNLDWKK